MAKAFFLKQTCCACNYTQFPVLPNLISQAIESQLLSDLVCKYGKAFNKIKYSSSPYTIYKENKSQIYNLQFGYKIYKCRLVVQNSLQDF